MLTVCKLDFRTGLRGVGKCRRMHPLVALKEPKHDILRRSDRPLWLHRISKGTYSRCFCYVDFAPKERPATLFYPLSTRNVGVVNFGHEERLFTSTII